jgi:phosphoribosylformimino-5-aminoimidazole carboxamide ribotide isomerase
MILFPAIDLKDGCCVRLRQGDMRTATVFNVDPAAQARAFAQAGCEWLHVIDLDGAFAGKPENAAAVDAILAAQPMPVQLGGGIRDLQTIEGWLKKGVQRVILGTVAVHNPGLVLTACRAYEGRIAIALDARGGRVATDGWSKETDLAALDVARRFEDLGCAAFIYTDIGRDGELSGPNLEDTVALARALDSPVILSGGISSYQDLERIKREGEGIIAGAICGRALYDGRIELARALALFAGGDAAADAADARGRPRDA